VEPSVKLARVAELARQAASLPDGDKLLREVVTTAQQVFSCRSVALLLVSEDTEWLSIHAASGLSESVIRDFRRPVGTGTVAEVLWAGSNLLYDRLASDAPERVELKIEHDPVSLMCVRLEVDSRALGYLACESDAEAAFSEDDLQLLKVMAEVSALAFDRDRLRQITRKLTMMDPLTQVYGYSYFHRRLSEEVERAQRLNECLSVMLVEIDNLREFRETNGWQATEQVLRNLVKLVSTSVRNIDVVGRYGVDAIILYLPETARDKATLAADRICTLVEEESKASQTPGLTVSIGLASLPENGDTVNRLLESVTSALLAAQRAGRNRVEAARAAQPG